MKNIDIDAVIELDRILRKKGLIDESVDGVANLVKVIRDSGVHVTSGNAVALDAEEQAAMDHLVACVKTIDGWYHGNNVAESGAAVNTLQSFIVQHMLHRLNPEEWVDWSMKQPI